MQTDHMAHTPDASTKTATPGDAEWNGIAQYGRETIALAKQHVLLFFVLLFVMLSFTVFYYVVTKPTYTASAVIGPPNPSPLNAMMSSTGLYSTIARKVIGGTGSSSNSPFEEYQQLIQSSRLLSALVEQDKILPIVFYKNWDGQTHRWRAPGPVGTARLALLRLMNRSVDPNPNDVTLGKYLDKNLTIEQSDSPAASKTALVSNSTGYLTLSLTCDDRETAEKLLDIILRRTDEIIRQEQLNDVEARISYIKGELLNTTQAEQKESLIQILTSQEELKVMMVADKRFSYVLVSPPYASMQPTKPGRPSKAFVLALFLSLGVWMGLAGVATVNPTVRRAIDFFALHRRA